MEREQVIKLGVLVLEIIKVKGDFSNPYTILAVLNKGKETKDMFSIPDLRQAIGHLKSEELVEENKNIPPWIRKKNREISISADPLASHL